MKRHPCLVPLSDDHHQALVLARRLRESVQGGGSAGLEALASDVRHVFDSQLEPHFQVEERWLAPPLERAGAVELVRQLRADHERVRELVRDVWTWNGVAELGALLERHVRFEERVLFPEAEARLSTAELDAVREAARR